MFTVKEGLNPLNPKQPFRTPIAVRFNDIDVMGHVNNALIFTYFEEGRKALFYETLAETTPDSFNFIIAHLECDYIRPVFLGDRLSLDMWVTGIGNKSFTLAYALVDENDAKRVFAKGASVQVCYDYDHRQSILVPKTLKTALMAYHLTT
jgi:acyl-CoA thioester hydrolase